MNKNELDNNELKTPKTKHPRCKRGREVGLSNHYWRRGTVEMSDKQTFCDN
jgi:hypothetical protein